MSDPELCPGTLRSALQSACRPQNAGQIEAGRHEVLALPRQWVVSQIEATAVEALDLTDYWEYRRLLELAALLDTDLVRRLAALGSNSTDPDILEASADFGGWAQSGGRRSCKPKATPASPARSHNK